MSLIDSTDVCIVSDNGEGMDDLSMKSSSSEGWGWGQTPEARK